MSGEIVAWVLFAAFLHAFWNALLKKGADVTTDSAAMWLGGSLAVTPTLLFLPLPHGEVWGILALSVVVHVAYYVALVGAYKGGALSVAYPIMRGVAPAFVALGSVPLLGEALSAHQLFSIALICLGVLAISGIWKLQRAISARSLGFALLTAFLIAIYTVIDGKGARLAASSWSYAVWLMFLQGWVVLGAALYLRRKTPINWRIFVNFRGIFAGAISIISYGIALWAMTRAPIGLVAALRETSVLFATLLGALMLKEAIPRSRWFGVAIVLAGVVSLRVAR
jgi:drug/metabolite transporter (DMT)-like permease